ncbi:MAG: CidA/LrgA family protein [Erysipelothrix sp.]|nr:CidA/LrgA family protein [Erysipelothrix sp.]
MKILKQLLIIITFYIIGESITNFTGLKVPGSVIGLLLLFLALEKDVIELDSIKETGNWLKNNMSFLFVPLSVGLMNSFGILKLELLPLTIVMIVSTTVTLIVVALVSDRLGDK